MKRFFLIFILLSLALGTGANVAHSGTYTFSNIDVPGTQETVATGINKTGQIVGTYYDSDGTGHGFLWSGGVYTTIDVPGAIWTEVSGINEAGQIVGFFWNGSGTEHGFLLSAGVFTALDIPGIREIYPLGINDAGRIVGVYFDGTWSSHGFLLSGGVVTYLDVPGAQETSTQGINKAGQVVGYYYNSGIAHGFLWSGGVYTTIDVPGVVNNYAVGINDAGQIVGYYYDSGVAHGFLWNGGVYTTLDVPGSQESRASGINEAGQIVGVYFDNSWSGHGFLAAPMAASLQTNDIGSGTYIAATPDNLIYQFFSPHSLSPDSPNSFNVCFDSQVNLKSGNLYQSQYAGRLSLSYNSIDTYSGPVGKKWTHNLNLKLTASNNNALTLKSGDGNIINFTLSNGVYYPEARSGDTSRIVKNADGTYTRTTKNGTSFVFNSAGSLVSIVDRNNNTINMTYSGSDLASITEPSGRITSFTATSGLITSITDPGGRTYSLTYTSGLLSSITDPLGNVWRYTYDTDGKMLTKTDPAGYTITYMYDTSGRVLTSTDPEGKTSTMNYSQAGTSTYTAKDGGLWTYNYDPIFVVKTAKTDPLGSTTRYTFDTNRSLISTTAPDGSVTSYTYDIFSNITSVTDPLGNKTSYAFNNLNLATSRTDPKGGVMTYAYDAKGNLTKFTDASGAVTTLSYDTKGNITAITDTKGKRTSLVYDSRNNLISITDRMGNFTAFTYDAVGNRLSITDPLGNITQFAYNGINQMTQMTDPKGNITQYDYDYKGNIAKKTDASGNPTDYAYNYLGHLIRIIDAVNNLTKMAYGRVGCGGECRSADKLTSLTDALNHGTKYTYDLAGHRISETDPQGKIITYSYDKKGNLITKTKADGKTVTYTYDADNRLIQKEYSNGSVTRYQYDGNGNMIYAGNAAIAYNFVYDANNRITGIADSNKRTIQYQYDLLGNKVKMITPEGKSVTYAYDSNSRLTTINADAGKFSISYDADGRRKKLTYPNKTTASYIYDISGNLTRIKHTGPSGMVLTEADYTYDSINNRLTRSDVTKTEAYSYDPLSRLVKSTLSSRQHPVRILQGGESYVYDSVGNRLQGPAGTDALSYDDENELLSSNSTTYGYDLNGNRIRKNEKYRNTTYSYDDENRLVKLEMHRGNDVIEVTFAYDPFGRRIAKTLLQKEVDKKRKKHDFTFTRTSQYVYDGQNIILEYMNHGNEKGIINNYIHGPSRDEPLVLEVGYHNHHRNFQPQYIYYYHADGLGSIVGLTNAIGHLVQVYKYDSFGNIKNQDDDIRQPYTYTAREFDFYTGLYLNRARYYDPKVGRFLQRDPIGFKGGDVNLYAYAKNNPVNHRDPSGLQAWDARDSKEEETINTWSPIYDMILSNPFDVLVGTTNKAGDIM